MQKEKKFIFLKIRQYFLFLLKKYPDCAAICGNGQPRLATLLLLDFLKEKHSFYYHGDFDPEGLLIAQQIERTVWRSICLWNYRADWYENATYYDADGNATLEDPSNISMTRSSYQHNRYDFNVRVDYKNTFNDKHNVLLTLVHNRQYYHGTSLSAGSNTFYLSTIHQIQNGDASSITASNKESEQASMGYVGSPSL